MKRFGVGVACSFQQDSHLLLYIKPFGRSYVGEQFNEDVRKLGVAICLRRTCQSERIARQSGTSMLTTT